jgi:diguanylate cyclase
MHAPRFRSSRWSRRVQQVLVAIGPLRGTLLLTLVVAVAGLVIGNAMVMLAGGGRYWLASTAVLVCAVVIAPLMGWPLLGLLCELEAARAQLDVLATRDDLTAIYNRRHFLVQAERELARCRRYDMAAAVLMIDVDNFKRTNDAHGHLVGDLVLREIARASGDTLRQVDLLGRFGGEEFIVFLPHTDQLGAIDTAERIRSSVAKLALQWKGQTVGATVSIGVVSLDATHDSLGTLILDADQALYAAKDAGRNCVRVASMQSPRRGAANRVTPH